MSHLQQQFYEWKWNKETNVDMVAAPTLPEQGILCEKVKQYSVLFDKQLKGSEKNMLWPIHGMQWQRSRYREVFIILPQK